MFSMLLENGSDLLQEDGEGCGPLHHAAREGYVQVAGKLLELGAKVQFFLCTQVTGRTLLDRSFLL